LAQAEKEEQMALVRVVEFDEVGSDRAAEIKRQVEQEDPPGDMPATEIVVLHDADQGKALVAIFFDSDDDYARGDEILNAMSADDTPGRRTGVTKYEVAARRSL
jgi:hypothetical protein